MDKVETGAFNFLVFLSLLLRELKKGETFARLLNIHSGDIRVVPTHLVSHAIVYIPERVHKNKILDNITLFYTFFSDDEIDDNLLELGKVSTEVSILTLLVKKNYNDLLFYL